MEDSRVKPRLLLVDDDPNIPFLLSEKLSREGFHCQSCSSAEEALRLMAKRPFDLVISDLQMPGISGLQFLEEIRQKYPRLAFLIVTGQNDIGVGIDAMKRGASDYLIKPFQLNAVVASVQRALETKHLEFEIENYRHHLESMVEQRTKQLQAAMQRVELTYDQTLEALAAALDLRDYETAGHSRRVTSYSLEIANQIECSAEELKNIARGSHLHDIGKIGIRDAILLKPGKLTEEEKAIMETHARIGYELVSRIGFLAPAAQIVLTHQERYDGTGYPQGLVGEEIPLGSRIFAIADTLDAMTSDRPYRRALPFATTCEEIAREAGRQFDPELVKVFLSIPQQTWEDIRRETISSHKKVVRGSSDTLRDAGGERHGSGHG